MQNFCCERLLINADAAYLRMSARHQSIIGYVTGFRAMTLTPVALVAARRECSVTIVVLIGRLQHERSGGSCDDSTSVNITYAPNRVNHVEAPIYCSPWNED